MWANEGLQRYITATEINGAPSIPTGSKMEELFMIRCYPNKHGQIVYEFAQMRYADISSAIAGDLANSQGDRRREHLV